MPAAPPSWYPDPANPRVLRYWDGAQWTQHVVVPRSGSLGPDTRSDRQRRGVRHLSWVGLVLVVLAIVAVAVPGVGFARASSADGVRLDGTNQRVHLHAHEKYGIYIDDADNSGYSETCSAHDADGRVIHLADPSWSMSSSDTETLDYVFDTGSGDLTISCSVPGERVTTRPVANIEGLLIGLGIAAIAGCAGAVLIVVRFVTRPKRRTDVTAVR